MERVDVEAEAVRLLREAEMTNDLVDRASKNALADSWLALLSLLVEADR
jgi:hypothetical protein